MILQPTWKPSVNPLAVCCQIFNKNDDIVYISSHSLNLSTLDNSFGALSLSLDYYQGPYNQYSSPSTSNGHKSSCIDGNRVFSADMSPLCMGMIVVGQIFL